MMRRSVSACGPIAPPVLLASWLVLAGLVHGTAFAASMGAVSGATIAAAYLAGRPRWSESIWLANAAAVLTLVLSAAGLWAWLFSQDLGLGSFRRVTWPGTPPGLYAAWLEASILLSIGAHSRLRIPALAAGVTALLATLSRWAILGTVAGFVYLVSHMPLRRAVSTAAILCGIGLVALVAPPMHALRDQYLVDRPHGWMEAFRFAFTPSTGYPERVVIWRTTLRMVRAHPLFGTGPDFYGQYQRHFDLADRAIRVPELPAHLAPVHAHNDALHLAAQWGLPATTLYAVSLAWAIVRGVRGRRAATGIVIAYVIHGLWDAVTTAFAGPALVLWSMIGASVHPEGRGDGAHPALDRHAAGRA